MGEGLLGKFAFVFIIMLVSSPYFLTVPNLPTAASVVRILRDHGGARDGHHLRAHGRNGR